MIVTFYSYKGGVGRSFCLANIAVQLARWGNRVLCVDFDLDAPGLHQYFHEFVGPPKAGLVEVISGAGDWRDAVLPVTVPETESLSLLAAGRMDEGYPDRAQALSWPDLFENHDLGWRIEKMREEWLAEYDYVLIDSRTGVTDIGGICTAQLPDVLVLCVAPNWQNLNGALEVARRAAAARDRLPYDRAGLLYLPVVSRFDGKEEYERARLWRTRMAGRFAQLYASWLPTDLNDDQPELGLVERTTVPYLPYWSFGEEIAVLDERSNSPDSVAYYMDNIAALLAHRLADADVLVSNRDTYVSAARERGRRGPGEGFRYDVLVYGTSEHAVDLTEELLNLGVRAVRGRLAELPMVRHFVIIDPPALPSAAVQEILDQVQLDSGRLVMVVGEMPRQLSSAHPLTAGSARETAIDVVSALAEQGTGARWERVLMSASRALQSQGNETRAYLLAVRAMEAAEIPIQSSLLVGELAGRLGRIDEAEFRLNRVLRLVSSNSPEAQRAHRLLGEIYRDKDDLASALDHFRAALAGSSGREQALVHRELSQMELRAGNTQMALQHLRDALERSAGDVLLEAQSAFELGSMLVDLGAFEAAGRQLVEAVEWNALPPDDQLTALRQLAFLESADGRHHGAAEYLARALDLAVRREDKVDITIELVQVQRDVHGVDAAFNELHAAYDRLDHDDFAGRARFREEMGNLLLDGGAPGAAAPPFAEAQLEFRRLGDRAGEIRALIGLAGAYKGADHPAAIETWNEARRLLTRLRGPEADLLRRQLNSVDPR